jgi:hypothetical protein
MSHTTSGDLGTTFIHNGDYSGNVTVHRLGQPRIEVPFADLRELVFGYLRRRMIEGLEQASDDTLEAMLTNGTGVTW